MSFIKTIIKSALPYFGLFLCFGCGEIPSNQAPNFNDNSHLGFKKLTIEQRHLVDMGLMPAPKGYENIDGLMMGEGGKHPRYDIPKKKT